MRQKLIEALTWALRHNPDSAALKWPVAVLAAACFGLLLFAIFQYQTSERRWGMKLLLGLLGGAVVVGLGASAFHWVTGALYGVGYFLTWLAWVLTHRWSWWCRPLACGLIAGLSLGPWLWLGATEKNVLVFHGDGSGMAGWLLTSNDLVWFWMLLGALWLMGLVGGWGCWRWPLASPQHRRWLVAIWAVLSILGLNWYAAGRMDLLTVCAKGRHWRLAYLLVSRPGSQWYRGVDVFYDMEKLDREGFIELGVSDWTPLHAAAATGQTATVRLLLAAGAKVNAKAMDGSTPLHATAENRRTATVRQLLAAGADITATDYDGRTPLHRAAEWGNAEAIRLLLAAGAKVNAKAKDGRTPLHWAAMIEEPETSLSLREGDGTTVIVETPLEDTTGGVCLLLAAGARVNERDATGQTALDLTRNSFCEAVLRKAGGKTGAALDAEKAAPK